MTAIKMKLIIGAIFTSVVACVATGVVIVQSLGLTPSVTGSDANTILQQNELLRQ